MSRLTTIIDGGQWYKGNTHAHTCLSDGNWTPAELASQYIRRGYSFIAITDHRRYGVHAELNRPGFLVLPGVELDTETAGPPAFCHHVVGLGLPGQNQLQHGQSVEYPADTTLTGLVQLLRSKGNLCLYAHPNWSHVSQEALLDIDGLAGLEIFNNLCEVNHASGCADAWYDRLLWQGRRLWCVACDDTHQYSQDAGGGFIMVKSETLTAEAVIGSLLTGSFYASEGPAIDSFFVEDGQAFLQCSPCRSVGFLTDSCPGTAWQDPAAAIREAVWPIHAAARYCRAVCTDRYGRRAWSQPIWLDGVSAGPNT
jgi:hypothetical protein